MADRAAAGDVAGKLRDIDAEAGKGFVVVSAHPTGGSAKMGTDAFTGQHECVYIPATEMLQ